MRLLQIQDDGKPVLINYATSSVPPYAILSHTWGPDAEEVTFADMVDGSGTHKAGYRKIQLCAEYSALDRLQHFWVDSCCIDKSSSSELSCAINSMFQWYQKAAKCYVYLSDVATDGHGVDGPLGWETSFMRSRWFTRGWTLQELVAPSSMQFLSTEGRLLGDKASLERLIHVITGIPVEALRGKALSDFSRKERMLWAEGRTTKLEEDRAYSLLGIFGIHIPLIYGEGAKNAFIRLEEAIDKRLSFEHREAEEAPAGTPKLSELEESCLQSLWYPTMNARRLNLENPARQTCCWLFKHDGYRNWFHGRDPDEHQGLLWLAGNPGSGKSVLMKEAFRRAVLEQDHSNFCTAAFFFDAKGRKRDRSPSGLFRSLLYQLLPKYRGHLERFCQLWKERNVARNDSETVVSDWQETELRDFLRSMFVDRTTKRTILFIDSLDECGPDSARSQAYFWREVTKAANCGSFNLHVCFSSRHTIAVSLSGVEKIIMENCNGQDIATYVDQRFTLGNVITDPRWESLKEKVLIKSSGIFLWVVLVMEQILKHWDHGRNMKCLMDEIDRVPEGLRELFSQMLSSLDPKEKALTLRLFQWAVLATKPLRLHEWHHIMAFIRSPTPRSLREWRRSEFFTENDDQLVKQIRIISKGLIDVRSGLEDARNEGLETLSIRARAGSLNLEGGESRIVSVIHESVREFFLEGSGFGLLDPMHRINHIGHGHLSIIGTCLDYLYIDELDMLVLARLALDGQEKHHREIGPEAAFGSDTFENTAEHHLTERLVDGTSLSQPLQPSLAHPSRNPGLYGLQGAWRDGNVPEYERQVPLENTSTTLGSILKRTAGTVDFGTLSHLTHPDKYSDILSWLESCPMDHVLASLAGTASSINMASNPPTDISITGQSQPLEDYPALLSYATFELFTHAKLAEMQGSDPVHVISRFLDKQTWSRWVALREDVDQHISLEDYATRQGLVSWKIPPNFPRHKPTQTVDPEVTRGPDGRYRCIIDECALAPDGFLRRYEWNKHMDNHNRPYRCSHEGCESLPGFTYSGGLLRHEREIHGKHGGPKQTLNCPHQDCKRHTGKGFSRRENLNEHLRRVHTNEARDDYGGKPPRRQGSVASFSSAGSHTGEMKSPAASPPRNIVKPKPEARDERPYRCGHDGCENLPGFSYYGGLLRHEREIHRENGGPKKTLNCPYENCRRHKGKAFSRRENLNEHIRRVHGEAPGDTYTPTNDIDGGDWRKRKRPSSDAPAGAGGEQHFPQEAKRVRSSSVRSE